MAFHCLGSRGVAEMEYTYSGFCACVVILWDGHGVFKFFLLHVLVPFTFGLQ